MIKELWGVILVCLLNNMVDVLSNLSSFGLEDSLAHSRDVTVTLAPSEVPKTIVQVQAQKNCDHNKIYSKLTYFPYYDSKISNYSSFVT